MSHNLDSVYNESVDKIKHYFSFEQQEGQQGRIGQEGQHGRIGQEGQQGRGGQGGTTIHHEKHVETGPQFGRATEIKEHGTTQKGLEKGQHTAKAN